MHCKGLGRIGRVVLLIGLAQLIAGVGVAIAAWGGADPKSNYRPGPLPSSCSQSPTGAKCINAGVYYLDKARARLGQQPYKLPANFVQLGPEVQAFILTNLDRTQYGLPAITGMTSALNRDAMGALPHDPYGVLGDGDPSSTDPNFQQTTSNWAGGFPNIVLAYEAWMYNDGYGSPNGACTTRTSSGCWGHRHDILWKFVNTGGPYAIGVAAGKDRHGTRGFAMLLGRGTAAYHPKYSYTWSQAVADGAGKHNFAVHRP